MKVPLELKTLNPPLHTHNIYKYNCKVNKFCFKISAGLPGEPGAPGELGPPGRKVS